jgi:hypothetical protein
MKDNDKSAAQKEIEIKKLLENEYKDKIANVEK